MNVVYSSTQMTEEGAPMKKTIAFLCAGMIALLASAAIALALTPE